MIQRAEGVWVWDVEGNKYLDFLAAYSAVNQGHSHPRIRQALVEQAERVTLTSRAFRNDQLGPLYKEVHELTGYAADAADEHRRRGGRDGDQGRPQVGLQGQGRARRARPRSSSSPATSTAARRRSSASPTTRSTSDGFGPFTPGFTLLPYGDLEAVAQAMNPNVVAILVEPIQGESGIIIPPDGLPARASRELCREHGALLIVDEIQSGLGRTGKLFAFEHEGVRPDIVIIGKALAGGFYPVSAILADDEVMGVFHPGDHGSTFGGNPLGCAVAREALKVLVEEKLIENSAELGDYFIDKLRTIGARQHQGGPRPRPVDRPRADARGRRRAPLLRGAAEARACSARRPTSTRSASRRRCASRARSWTGPSSASRRSSTSSAESATQDVASRTVEIEGVTLHLAHPDELADPLGRPAGDAEAVAGGVERRRRRRPADEPAAAGQAGRGQDDPGLRRGPGDSAATSTSSRPRWTPGPRTC